MLAHDVVGTELFPLKTSGVSSYSEGMLGSRLTVTGDETWHFDNTGICSSSQRPIKLLQEIYCWLKFTTALAH